MTKRFIISTSNLAGIDQQKKFADRLNTSNLNWWHWLPNTWLVVDYQGAFTAASYGKALREDFPSAWFTIFEYKPTTDWMAFGPTGSGKIDTDMLAWIKQHWVNPNSVVNFLA